MIIRNTATKKLGEIVGLLKDLEKAKVVVGVTAATNGRDGGLSNAMIAAVHEFGSPAQGIPERSFLRSTVTENADKYAKMEAEKVKEAIASGRMSTYDAYSVIGNEAMNDVKLKIANGPFKALDEKTVERKGSSKPLIDTGALRQAITFEVRE